LLKEKIKEAQSDLELLQREYQLDQINLLQSTMRRTAPERKLAAMKQRISDKQQELDH